VATNYNEITIFQIYSGYQFIRKYMARDLKLMSGKHTK